MSRLLHEPTIRLRSLGEDRGHAGLEMVRELFALGEDGHSLEEPAGNAFGYDPRLSPEENREAAGKFRQWGAEKFGKDWE